MAVKKDDRTVVKPASAEEDGSTSVTLSRLSGVR